MQDPCIPALCLPVPPRSCTPSISNDVLLGRAPHDASDGGGQCGSRFLGNGIGNRWRRSNGLFYALSWAYSRIAGQPGRNAPVSGLPGGFLDCLSPIPAPFHTTIREGRCRLWPYCPSLGPAAGLRACSARSASRQGLPLPCWNRLARDRCLGQAQTLRGAGVSIWFVYTASFSQNKKIWKEWVGN